MPRFALSAFGMLALAMSFALAQNAPDLQTVLDRGPLKADGTPAAYRAHTGILVQDAQTGETLLSISPQEAFTPASSMKALVSAAALYILGPGYTFKTNVLAPAATGGRVDRLTLRGSGDPTLHEKGEGNSLEALAKAVAAAGIKSVGEVRVDDYAFAQDRWGSGWMWDDTEYPIGALRLDNDDATYLRLVLEDDEVKAGIKTNPTMLTDPSTLSLAVGERFAALLNANGVTVSGKVTRAKADATDKSVAEVASVPLGTLLRLMNKMSVNIYAEQLRAALGIGTDGTPSTNSRATAAIAAYLKSAGIASDDYRLRDGSGLTRYNLVTPQQMTAAMRYAYLNPAGVSASPLDAFRNHTNVLIESFPVAGTGEATPAAKENGGTLRNRLVNSGLDVRAKTGSMTGISSLTGFLTAKTGRVLVFTILMDNYPAGISDLTRWQDEMLKALAAKY